MTVRIKFPELWRLRLQICFTALLFGAWNLEDAIKTPRNSRPSILTPTHAERVGVKFVGKCTQGDVSARWTRLDLPWARLGPPLRGFGRCRSCFPSHRSNAPTRPEGAAILQPRARGRECNERHRRPGVPYQNSAKFPTYNSDAHTHHRINRQRQKPLSPRMVIFTSGHRARIASTSSFVMARECLAPSILLGRR